MTTNDKAGTHGDFTLVSILAQDLQQTVREDSYKLGTDDPPEFKLEPTTRAAIEQILLRIARIVHGDENYRKHWEDIQGFCQAKLDAVIATAAPTIETDIQRLVRTLPVAARVVEKANGSS